MAHFTPLGALLGGVLLGIASSMLFLLSGRICGISGIIAGIVGASKGDRLWRAVFVAGMLSAGFALAVFDRSALATAIEQKAIVAAVAGVLVGIGTRAANGCTSGHGLCGIALLAPRSIIATGVFIATGAATTFVARHVLAGGLP